MPTLWVNNFLSWVKPRRVWINDGGSWFSPRNIFVNNGGTWTRVFSRGLWTTITSGSDGSNTGYNQIVSPIPPFMGSASEVTLVDGRTLGAIYYNTFGTTLIVIISGFTSDPGQSYLSQVVIAGWGTATVGDGNYVGYNYGSAAQWTWTSGVSPFANGVQTALEIYTS